MKTRSWSYLLAILFITASLLLSSCAMPGLAPAATNTPVPTNTPKATATSTPKPTTTPRPSPTANLAATQAYEDFSVKAKEYFDAGYITSSNGSYDKVEDFSDSWAQIGWYQWTPTDFSPTNFILKTDVSWTSASKTPDVSGCGFVFRLQEDEDHYVVLLSLDGYVYSWSNAGGNVRSMGQGYYGSAKQTGSATLTLVVEGDQYRVLVNDKLIKTFTGFAGKLSRGDLAYTILSGTNKSYGTKCEFENIELWTIEE
jgi:hypothetical protein